jgi:hypothetical protein
MKLSEIVDKSAKVVYHCTSYEAGINILKHDYFRATKGKHLTGLSTTTDKHYFWGRSEVRFVLDLAQLRRDYKVEETDEKITMNDRGLLDESELVVVSDSAITEAHKYIIKVEYTSGQFAKKFLEQLEEYKKKFDITSDVLQKD